MWNPDKNWEQIMFIVAAIICGFIASRILRVIVGRFFRKAALKLNVDPTHYSFFKNAVDMIITLITLIVIFRSIPALRTFGTTLLTGAGILAAIVGFASQQAFSNIVSGLFLVIFKPFSVGDRVKIGTTYSGDVEDITLRHTVIKDFENRRVVIPNSVISNEVIINSTFEDEKICVFMEFPVAWNTDLEVITKIAEENALKHPYCIDNRNEEAHALGEKQVMVRVMALTELAINIRVSAWARNPAEAFEMKCDLLRTFKEEFQKAGLDVPYPHRVIINQQP
jgi:small conductance mechanosensitive channel